MRRTRHWCIWVQIISQLNWKKRQKCIGLMANHRLSVHEIRVIYSFVLRLRDRQTKTSDAYLWHEIAIYRPIGSHQALRDRLRKTVTSMWIGLKKNPEAFSRMFYRFLKYSQDSGTRHNNNRSMATTGSSDKVGCSIECIGNACPGGRVCIDMAKYCRSQTLHLLLHKAKKHKEMARHQAD